MGSFGSLAEQQRVDALELPGPAPLPGLVDVRHVAPAVDLEVGERKAWGGGRGEGRGREEEG